MSRFIASSSIKIEAAEENSVSLIGRQASFRGTGSSLASDPYGYGKCHYDVGNIIDHAITTFVNPFTSDVPSEALAFSLFIAKWAEAGFK
ncbi:hypothetical protein ACWXWU_16950 [Shewanella sp. A14]